MELKDYMWKLVVDRQRDSLNRDTKRTTRETTDQRVMETDQSLEEGLRNGSEAHALSVEKMDIGRKNVQREMKEVIQSHWQTQFMK